MSPTNRYLDPTNDVCFKRIFSDVARMQDFLNAMLRLPEGKKIETLEFVPTEQIPNLGQGKRSLFDLKCQDQSGTQFLVEMQCRRTPFLMNRIQYYAAHAYTAQIQAGEKAHGDLLPIVVLTIMGETLFPPHVEVISYHKVREEKSQECFLDALTYVFVELSKFNKSADQLTSFEDEWLYFLKTTEKSKEPPVSLKDPLVKDAYAVVERFNWTPESYDAYVRASLLLWDEEFEKKAEFKAGLEQGREEKIDMARALLQDGVSLEVIAKASGLSPDKLEHLLRKDNA